MPVSDGWSFNVSPGLVADFAADYLGRGGDPADGPRFFFGDLAVASLDQLASRDLTARQTRRRLGNLAASGYFGGIWLRDNLRDPDPAGPQQPVALGSDALSAIGIRLFDALAGGLVAAAKSPPPVATAAAHAMVPVLLTLYGYNRGYLDVLLENPPEGVLSMRDTLSCNGFLSCNSTAFPLQFATRYDGALDKLDSPSGLRWQELTLWTSALGSATGAGRFVWETIAQSGAFSPGSYRALVELSSAYLMVSKAAVLSSMTAYADGDADLARSSLLLQAGLWMWSGAYFAGLASSAPAGTAPTLSR